jgi:hypothetical protein
MVVFSQNSKSIAYQSWMKNHDISKVLKVDTVRKFNCCHVLYLSFTDSVLQNQYLGWSTLKLRYPDKLLLSQLFLQGVSIWEVHPDSFGIEISGGTEELNFSVEFNEDTLKFEGDTLSAREWSKKMTMGISKSYNLDSIGLPLVYKHQTSVLWKKDILYREIFKLIKKYFKPYNGSCLLLSPFGQSQLRVEVSNIKGCVFPNHAQPFLCAIKRWAFGDLNCDERPKEQFIVEISYSESEKKLEFMIEGKVASGRISNSNYRIMDEIGFSQQLDIFTQKFSTKIYNDLTKK